MRSMAVLDKPQHKVKTLSQERQRQFLHTVSITKEVRSISYYTQKADNRQSSMQTFLSRNMAEDPLYSFQTVLIRAFGMTNATPSVV